MKEQFDSAIQLMDKKLADQLAALNKAHQELAHKEAYCASVGEQLSQERRRGSELNERLIKVTADHKVSVSLRGEGGGGGGGALGFPSSPPKILRKM